MINPEIMYHIKSATESIQVKGVAVRLKDFLAKLDKYDITHDSEKAIRKWIRSNELCCSHMKQHFLKDNLDLVRIQRSLHGTTLCKTCVCIANTCLPDCLHDCFTEG